MKNIKVAKINTTFYRSKANSLLSVSFSPISIVKNRIIISNNSNINFVKNS